MTTISSAATLPARPGVLGRLLRLLRGWSDAIVTYWMRREAIKTLHELDDRSLRDIGIPRCHIEIAVAGNVDLELIRIR
ncbi:MULTISPECIES: DUF1127 domain-containing protein [unclassified Bradyrhizobium]|uniref:DUF1127 domain-containing protein n=1 Tax=unclassified Bradyrhizobium TaxID=2631580 RepID=UPI00247A7B42|nr:MULTISPECIES: DUF1127 domain-containing protein [unclassified Bradyrhizobium]WGS22938.1 DUF1127 domain-containing protein [Bradyrhizobium sp. ISRA463]WGS29938.1 DUF1127 domain-containing protein [Bradyrhizobium sp. ISRA464]